MAPKVDITSPSNLEKLIAAEQALIMKSALDQKGLEIEELKNKLNVGNERIKNLQKLIDSNIEKQRDERCSELIAEVIKPQSELSGYILF